MPKEKKIVVPTITPYSREDLVTHSIKYKNNYSRIHLDVIDLSYGTPTYYDDAEIEKNTFYYSKVVIHLMIQNPVLFLMNRRSLINKENKVFIIPFKQVNFMNIDALIKQGFKLGLSFELGDSCELDSAILQKIEEVMFLPIVPGSTGRKPDLTFLSKLEVFYNKYKLEFLDINVSLDGGFNTSNALEYLNNSANIVYANSFFNTDSLPNILAKLRTWNVYYNTKLIQGIL